jgi:hypothetical protein
VLDLLVANLLAAKRCDFMLGLAVNPVLKPMAAPWSLRCKQRDQRSGRWEANQFRLFPHMGASWLPHTRRRTATVTSP